jgi:uncharacterized protein (DUF58 family)
MRVKINKITQGLSEFGPRKLRRRGIGTEFYEARDFRRESDDPRRINARLSGRAGRPIIVEKEAEIRQHFYLWRDGSASMDFTSDDTRFTKKEASEVMLLAFAKHLAKNEELIGLLDQRGRYRGGKAANAIHNKMMSDVTVVTGDIPNIERRLPQNSTAVLFSDFLMDPVELAKGLERMHGQNLQGFLVMVLDPQELDFSYKGHVEFEGMEGEGREKFEKAETMRSPYLTKMHEHMRHIEDVCKRRGFKFIIQRTDRPLHNALLEIYGVKAKSATLNKLKL